MERRKYLKKVNPSKCESNHLSRIIKKIKFVDMEYFIPSTNYKLARAFESLCPELKILL